MLRLPYKVRLKSGKARVYKKADYKVINWSSYNKSLKKRGALSLYFPKGDLQALFINSQSYIEGLSGRAAHYRPIYIELIYMFYRLFNWGLRQMTGYFEDLWQNKGLAISVPSFGHLSDLFASLSLEVKHYCQKVVDKLKDGEDVTLIVDSTGMSFSRASDWYEEKYNKPCKNRPWRKLHLAIDPDMNMHRVELTDHVTDDLVMLKPLMPDHLGIDKVIADGAYYSIENGQTLSKQGIIPVIPPPKNAIVHGQENTTWHDKIVTYIKEKATVYAFHKKYGYGLRSLVEAQISRIKRCIGSTLLTRKIESQKNEAVIIANIINIWNSFGKPKNVKA